MLEPVECDDGAHEALMGQHRKKSKKGRRLAGVPTLKTSSAARRMSDTLVEFAQPLLAGLSPADVAAHEATLQLAAAFWNTIIQAELQAPQAQPTDEEWAELTSVRAAIELAVETVPDMTEEEMLPMLRELALHKQEVAPGDHRLVERVAIQQKGGRPVVVTVSRDLQELPQA